jgi:7-cyano-7-deazaguanine synthase in queuosine biosynthesis
MNILIDGVEIPLDRKWKKIAISLSGGADSALLAYLICNEYKEDIEIHIISHIRMWKTRPWQLHDSKKIFEYLNNQFQNIKFHRHENFISPAIEWGNSGPILTDEYGKKSSGDIIEIQSFAEYICFYNNIDAYFNAVTRNPKNVEFKGMDKRNVDPNENNQHLKLTTHMGKTVSHPFRFIEKSWIISQYRRLNILELLNLTRSCEGEFPGLDYTSYVYGQEVSVCNECFWCKERNWAINLTS